MIRMSISLTDVLCCCGWDGLVEIALTPWGEGRLVIGGARLDISIAAGGWWGGIRLVFLGGEGYAI